MLLASRPAPSYRCPGEDYDISHAVHVARQAAGYARCAECAHRGGRDPAVATRSADSAVPSSPWSGLFTHEGVRGVHRNALTRAAAARLAAAFAAGVWEDRAGAGSPLVVLAQDDRPSAPDLAVGAAAALRRMGCQVADIGPATRPQFWFAVNQLAGAGGIHVTGAGCDPGWTGLDFVRGGVLPCSRGDGLDAIAGRLPGDIHRPAHVAGTQQLAAPAAAYDAALRNDLHALRPLRLAVVARGRLQEDSLARLLRATPCRRVPTAAPSMRREPSAAHSGDVAAVTAAVREHSADLGLVLHEDSQRCEVFDERGVRVTAERLLQLLRTHEPGGDAPGAALDRTSPTAGAEPGGGTSLAEMSRVMRAPGVVLGADAEDRFWFSEAYPVCDALLTLVKLLQALSGSDTPLSERLPRLPAAAT